ncbi:MAG: hypothetical protein KGS48_01240 [Bacteroidetes bacterium]|nr:hypothetical protein [Bacteroidota bacterium]
MLNKNQIFTGLLVGILLPLVSFALLYQVFSLLEIKGAASSSGLSANFRERTLAIVAIAINLLPLNLYRRRRFDLAIRGIVLATAVLAIIWVIRYVPSMV